MNPKELQSLIANGENERVEFKTRNMSPEVIAKTVCGFLNREGGRLLLGVSDRGQLAGVADADLLTRRIESQLPSLISPPALWTVERMRVEGRDIVIVEVSEGMDKPYVTGGAIYFRRGERIVPANRNEISELIQNRAEASQRWERRIAMGADRVDLDDKLIQETTRMAVKSQRWQGSPNDIEGFLHALGLVSFGGVTNAALLLFGKQPSRLLPQARVRLLVLPEGKTGNQYSLDKTFDACVLQIAEQIPAALEAHAGGVASRFSEKNWQREDRSLYPITALREGVMNALVHRDYDANGSITISLLPEELQISNPGPLPNGLTPADLKRDHPSVPRNPDIAHVFFLRGLIEKIGRGTQRILEDCRKVGLRDPRWQSSGLETKLTFFAPATISRAEDLNERQQQILNLLREKKQLRAGDVAVQLGGGVTDRTVRNDLQLLVDRGWLVRRGRGRSTSYVEGSTVRSK
jgi:ATP-dependent DNA helicase RecG